MDAIVNVTSNWGIGFENRLLVTISSDLRRFRDLTIGKAVILGRKTLETFPNARPLKNRRNLILTHDRNFTAQGAEIFHELPELLAQVCALPENEVCVIGGAAVYEQLLSYCRRAFVTKTRLNLPADRFFPNLDRLPGWSVQTESPVMTEQGVEYQFVDYVNQNVRSI